MMEREVQQKERKELDLTFGGTPDFGRKASMVIPRYGAFSRTRVRISLDPDAIPDTDTDTISKADAYSLIQRVEWTIGGCRVQYYDGRALRALGHLEGEMGLPESCYDNDSSNLQWTLEVPLFFDDTPISPVLATYHEIRLGVEFTCLEDFCQDLGIKPLNPNICFLNVTGLVEYTDEEGLGNTPLEKKWCNVALPPSLGPFYLTTTTSGSGEVNFPMKQFHTSFEPISIANDEISVTLRFDNGCCSKSSIPESFYITIRPNLYDKRTTRKLIDLPIILKSIKVCAPGEKGCGPTDCLALCDKPGSYYSQYLPSKLQKLEGEKREKGEKDENLDPNTYFYNMRRGRNITSYITSPEEHRPRAGHYPDSLDHIHITLKKDIVRRLERKGNTGFKIDWGIFTYKPFSFISGMGGLRNNERVMFERYS